MPRYRLEIEYEGTRYSGWQIQPNARTIQGELHKAIEEGLRAARYEVGGAGRTDAGVHALAQTAHLQLDGHLQPPLLRRKLNDHLPADIAVVRVRPAAPSFHARHDALARRYLYQISRRRTALGKRLVWWIKDSLHSSRMQEAAGLFLGSHDFRSFTARADKDTRVSISEVSLEEAGDLLLVRLQASHFLWKMVRQIVGVLVGVGRGNLKPADIERFLNGYSEVPATLTAPPSGLFLERAIYAGEKATPGGAVLRVDKF